MPHTGESSRSDDSILLSNELYGYKYIGCAGSRRMHGS